MTSLNKTRLLRVVGLVLIGLVIWFARGLPFLEWLTALERSARTYPVAGAFAFIGATILATTLMTPGWIMMMLGGLVFGLWLGLAYTMLGIVGGAVAAFFVSRTLVRSWVERRIAGNKHLLALDDALEDQAFTIVTLTRIALVFPFNVLNYAYGVTRVKTRIYAAGTAVGMLPIVGFYVYLGTLTRDISQIVTEGAQVGAGAWWAGAIALVAIVSVVFVVRRALSRALKKRKDEDASREVEQ